MIVEASDRLQRGSSKIVYQPPFEVPEWIWKAVVKIHRDIHPNMSPRAHVKLKTMRYITARVILEEFISSGTPAEISPPISEVVITDDDIPL